MRKWIENMGKEQANGEVPIIAGVSLAACAREHKRFLKGKIIGRPKRTKEMTVAQLEAEGYVGIYEEKP